MLPFVVGGASAPDPLATGSFGRGRGFGASLWVVAVVLRGADFGDGLEGDVCDGVADRGSGCVGVGREWVDEALDVNADPTAACGEFCAPRCTATATPAAATRTAAPATIAPT
jgi:hypothetical protein